MSMRIDFDRNPTFLVSQRYSVKHYLSKPDPVSRSKYLDNVRSAILEAEEMAINIRSSKDFAKTDWRRLRVSIRRLDACKSLLGEMSGFRSNNSRLRSASAILKATGRIRDEQVLLATIPKKDRTADVGRPLEQFSDTVLGTQESLMAKIKSTFDSTFILSLNRSLLMPLSSISAADFHLPVNRMIERRCRHLKSMASKVQTAKSDSKLLHRFRIRAKKLRYLLKIVNPELRSSVRLFEPVIEEIQNAFGRLHDINTAFDAVKYGSSKIKKSSREKLLGRLKKERKDAFELALGKARLLRRML
jgi:CHAD domain-containing protein